MPAVVHVSAVQRPSTMTIREEDSARLRRSKHRSADRGLPTAALDELRQFFGTPEMPIKSMGSGFIIDPDGYIVTEDHVVENAEKVTVTFQDGKPHSARIIGRDPKTDLALLKIEVDHPLPYVGWGDSDTAQVGDWVVAIGNPFGLDASVSSGIISGRGRDIHLGPYDDFLQIDAAINLGNSGGPAFDLCGQVIGINTAIYLPNSGSVGIGFAVPANLAQPVIAQLKTRGNVERGWARCANPGSNPRNRAKFRAAEGRRWARRRRHRGRSRRTGRIRARRRDPLGERARNATCCSHSRRCLLVKRPRCGYGGRMPRSCCGR